MTSSDGIVRATPSPSSIAALPNWSTARGTAIIGTPWKSPSAHPPMPAWVTNALARPSTPSCGTHRCAVTFGGSSPSASRSRCGPTASTTSHGSGPNASAQARKSSGWSWYAEPNETRTSGRAGSGHCSCAARRARSGPTNV